MNVALQVLIAATIRNEQTFETFLNACRASPYFALFVGYVTSAPHFADFCGVERNGLTLEQLDFPLVPGGHQDGPFYPTSTQIQIWHITRS